MNTKVMWGFFIANICFFYASDGFADGREASPCIRVSISQEVDECAAYRYKVSDRKLNQEYRDLRKRVSFQYDMDHVLRDKFLLSIKRAQQAWIKYRDFNCATEAFEVDFGSVAHETIVNDCLARMTVDRANYFSKFRSE